MNSGILKMKKDNRPQGGLPIGKDGNSTLSLGQSVRAVFLCSNYFLLHKSVNSGILKMKRDNRPQGGLPKY